jgi:hypothetical protein
MKASCGSELPLANIEINRSLPLEGFLKESLFSIAILIYLG